jgi:exopolysaccharide production protein ExoQ
MTAINHPSRREWIDQIIPLPPLDFDALFAFAGFLVLLFIAQFGTLGALAFSALVLLYGLFRLPRLPAIFGPRAFLLLIPAVALASVLWSEAPKETLKYGLEFAATGAFGVMLSAAAGQRAVLKGLFCAFVVYLSVSLAMGGTVALGADGDVAFAGLNGGKNMLADVTSTGLLISAAVLATSLGNLKSGWWLAALIAGATAGYVLFEARSAGAMLGVALALMSFGVLIALRLMSLAARTTFTLLLAAVVAVAAVFYRSLSQMMIEFGARVFDKDPTLTGRTYLWDRAGDLIAEDTWLGKGFSAFWLQGNTDAEGLWRYSGIASRGGFNFHNTFVEILVHLGWVGLVVIAVAAIIGAVSLFVRFIAAPSLMLCFWVSLLIYQLVRMPIESIGLTPFYFSTALLFAAMGAAFGPAAPGPRRRADEPPVLVSAEPIP